MAHGVVLTLSTQRMNLDGSSYSLPHYCQLLVCYFLALSTCFAQRNSLAVSTELPLPLLHQYQGVALTPSTERANLNISRHHLSLYFALPLPAFLRDFFFKRLKMSRSQFLHHLDSPTFFSVCGETLSTYSNYNLVFLYAVLYCSICMH